MLDLRLKYNKVEFHSDYVIVFLLVLSVAAAEKVPVSYAAPDSDEIAILRDDRVNPDAEGRYSFGFETEDGIAREESGNEGGSQQGSISYTSPDGSPFYLKFVADENGYQPESDLLPVAPEFPHEIPQFVLDQIAFAAEEDAREAREPSRSYTI